jgi:predicted homoserine dehydrogenase-like protein
MLKQINWLVPNQIVLAEFTGKLGMEDFEEFQRQSRAMAEQAQGAGAIHFILDVRGRQDISAELHKLKNVFDAYKDAGDYSVGWIIVVDSHPDRIMQFVANIVMQIRNRRFRVFKEMDAAVDFLKERDVSLPI